MVVALVRVFPRAAQWGRILPRSPRGNAGLRRAGQRSLDVALEPAADQVDLGGPVVSTWSYASRLPGQEIRVTRGDLLRVQVRNSLPAPTTVHWHGIAITNTMDGVPALTQAPIAPSATFAYEFSVPDPGTYWFHPHVGTQLDTGLSAPLIVEDPNEPADYDHELVVVFDDWLDGTGRTPDQVLADLHTHGMGSMNGGGMGGTGMGQSALLGGDAGDVSYPYYLANGHIPTAARSYTAKAGQRIRLRLINAGADTAFRIGLPDQTMTLTHTDGYPITPTPARAVLLGMGERLDAIITMPNHPVPILGLAEGKNGLALLTLQPATTITPGSDPHAAADVLMTQPVTLANTLRATEAVTLTPRAPTSPTGLPWADPAPATPGPSTARPTTPTVASRCTRVSGSGCATSTPPQCFTPCTSTGTPSKSTPRKALGHAKTPRSCYPTTPSKSTSTPTTPANG